MDISDDDDEDSLDSLTAQSTWIISQIAGEPMYIVTTEVNSCCSAEERDARYVDPQF